MKKYKPINDYQTHDELFQKLGIKSHKPIIGNLGRAIMEASKNHRSIDWLKSQLDTYFDKLREQRKYETKRRKRHPNKRNDKDAA